jgi:hypothetical protein
MRSVGALGHDDKFPNVEFLPRTHLFEHLEKAVIILRVVFDGGTAQRSP